MDEVVNIQLRNKVCFGIVTVSKIKVNNTIVVHAKYLHSTKVFSKPLQIFVFQSTPQHKKHLNRIATKWYLTWAASMHFNPLNTL